jgi:hypothetical protein
LYYSRIIDEFQINIRDANVEAGVQDRLLERLRDLNFCILLSFEGYSPARRRAPWKPMSPSGSLAEAWQKPGRTWQSLAENYGSRKSHLVDLIG